MRLFAAIVVAVSHSSYFFFPNVLSNYFHLLSDISVYIFFLISGFLITKSAQSRPVDQFLINRIKRVYPALILNLIVISFVFAPITSRSIQMHLQFSDQFFYLIKGSTLIPAWQISIGNSLSYSEVSNGWNNPLWTVGIEVMCYLTILVIVKCFVKIIPSLSAILLFCALLSNFTSSSSGSLASTYIHYLFVFLLGGFVSLNPNTRQIYSVAIPILIVVIGTQGYGLLWYPVLLFVVLIIASVDLHMKFKLKNDYSYGIYLWHWPVLQLITNLEFGSNRLLKYILSVCLTLLFSIGSWHYLEKLFLAQKSKLIPDN